MVWLGGAGQGQAIALPPSGAWSRLLHLGGGTQRLSREEGAESGPQGRARKEPVAPHSSESRPGQTPTWAAEVGDLQWLLGRSPARRPRALALSFPPHPLCCRMTSTQAGED